MPDVLQSQPGGVMLDPEEAESRCLHRLVDFRGASVLEIGCGDGRLTWRYADRAASILALDPKPEEIERARAATPDGLRSRVTFQAADIRTLPLPEHAFDVALLSWSI